MIAVTMYECQRCQKRSDDAAVIRQCEAAHDAYDRAIAESLGEKVLYPVTRAGSHNEGSWTEYRAGVVVQTRSTFPECLVEGIQGDRIWCALVYLQRDGEKWEKTAAWERTMRCPP